MSDEEYGFETSGVCMISTRRGEFSTIQMVKLIVGAAIAVVVIIAVVKILAFLK
jgi:hypothetical protein